MCRVTHLEQYRERLGFHPWHFWQFADNGMTATNGAVIPLNGACSDVMREHPYQAGGNIARGDIREALRRAERELASAIGYPLVDTAVESERVALSRHDHCKVGHTCVGGVKAIGALRKDVLASGVAVTYADNDGDGLYDTWTAGPFTVPAGTTADEIVAEFVEADYGLPSGDASQWQIYATATVSGATATLTGRPWTMARPRIYESFAASYPPPVGTGDRAALNPYHAANYAQTVDVYRCWVDEAAAVEYSRKACACENVCACKTDACCVSPFGADAPTAQIDNCKYGRVLFSSCADADYATFSYVAGPGCPCGCDIGDALYALTTTFMAAPCCVCSQGAGNGSLYARWHNDIALRNSERVYLGETVTRTTWGTTEGAILAQSTVDRCATTRAFKI